MKSEDGPDAEPNRCNVMTSSLPKITELNVFNCHHHNHQQTPNIMQYISIYFPFLL